MVVANTDFKLLFSYNVLLWPVRVVFPVKEESVFHFDVSRLEGGVLGDFARLDDALELLHHKGSNPH